MRIFDILDSISFTKKDLSDHEDFDKEYQPFMINRFLSMHPDTVFAADLINRYSGMSKKLQYMTLLELVPKKKRFFKYEKKEKVNEEISIIMFYFNVNEQKAEDYVKLLSSEDKKNIKEIVKEMM